MTPAMRVGLLAVAIALLVVLVIGLAPTHGSWLTSRLQRVYQGGDFVAFYCAGRIAATGEDPYRIEPLRRCEHSLDSLGKTATAEDVTPAPLPGYDFALFGLLARLPYSAAMALWYVVLLGSLAVSTFCLRRVTGIPWYVVLAALALPFTYANLQVAQIPPVAVAALCVAAFLLTERRFALAGVAAALSMIEPHIGLPACLALLLFAPACRVGLAAMAGVFAIASVAMIGIAGNLEYFTRVLPLHALAEAGASDQLSFTWLLHWFGAGDAAAVAVGSISYAVMTAIGLALARTCSRAFGSDHFLALVPPAVAMLGGAFVHNLQYLAVIPAALAVAAAIDTAPAWAAVMVFAVPWQALWASKPYLAAEIVGLAIIVWYVIGRAVWPIGRWLVAGAIVVLAVFAIGRSSDVPVRDAGSPTAFYDSLRSDQQQLASAVWGERERRDPVWAQASVRTFVSKAPLWAGVLLMIGGAGFALARRRSVATAAPAPTNPRLSAAALLLVLVTANLCLTLALSATLNIDVDESYTLYTTSGSPHDAFDRALGFEFQPPLYFVALQAWRQLDGSVFFGRLLSVLSIAATVLVAAAISRRVAPGMNPAWLAAAVALNPFAIWCAVELRVYAFLALLASLLLLTFLDGFLAERRSLAAQIAFVLVATIGLYSHYYIGFLLLGFGAALLALRRWRALGSYAVAGACVAIAFLPVVSAVAHQTSLWGSESSAGPSFARNFGLLIRHLTLIALPVHWARSTALLIAVAAVVAVFAGLGVRAIARAWPLRLPAQLGATAIAVAVGGLALVAALSVTHQQFENRYAAVFFVPSLACVCAAFATLDGVARYRLAGAWLGVVLVAGCISLIFDYSALAKVGDWQRVAAYIMRAEQPDEPILVFQSYGANPLRYYYRGENQLVGVPRTPSMTAYDPRDFELTNEREIVEALARAPGAHRRIWVVASELCDPANLVDNCAIFESYLMKHYVVIRGVNFYKATLRELARRQDESGNAVSDRRGAFGASGSSHGVTN